MESYQNRDYMLPFPDTCCTDYNLRMHLNKPEATQIFNAIYTLQFLSGYEHIVKELTEKLIYQFEQAVIKDDKKYLNNLVYQSDGIITNSKQTLKIIAPSWNYVKPENEQASETLLDLQKKNVIKENSRLLTMYYQTGVDAPLFVQQIKMAMHMRITKSDYIKDFAKDVKMLDTILKAKQEERFVFENFKVPCLINTLCSILNYISYQNKMSYDNRFNGILDKKGFDTLIKLIKSDKDLKIVYEKHGHTIRDLIDNHVKPDEILKDFIPEATAIKNRYKTVDLKNLDSWIGLPLIKNVYEHLYADNWMKPIYEKLGFIIKDYHPLQSI